VPEIIDPVFAKTSRKRSILITENERLGLVFGKYWVYKFGRRPRIHRTDKMKRINSDPQHWKPLLLLVLNREELSLWKAEKKNHDKGKETHLYPINFAMNTEFCIRQWKGKKYREHTGYSGSLAGTFFRPLSSTLSFLAHFSSLKKALNLLINLLSFPSYKRCFEAGIGGKLNNKRW